MKSEYFSNHHHVHETRVLFTEFKIVGYPLTFTERARMATCNAVLVPDSLVEVSVRYGRRSTSVIRE